MTDSSNPVASEERSSRYPVDPEFYYRVDRTGHLRRLAAETHFKPVRWDKAAYRFPHSALRDADERRPQEHGIFRICFWINEPEGRHALESLGHSDPHTLLRVRRSIVSESFPGWNFDIDDALAMQADMIWTMEPVEDKKALFSPRGVPLEAFEAWCERHSSWVPMREAERLLPDRIQMARIGWRSAFVHSPRSGSLVCHWQIVPLSQGPDAEFVVLTCVDDDCHANLGGDDACVSDLVDQLLQGPLAAIQPDVVALITIHTTDDRLWIEQFGIAEIAPRRRAWFGLRKAATSDTSYTAERRWVVKPEDCYRLIELSGLRLAKITRPSAWLHGG